MKCVVHALTVLAALPFLVSSQSLPGDSFPTGYHLKLEIPDLETATNFNGSIQMNVTVKSTTSSIVLHARNLVVNSSSVQVQRRKFSSWVNQLYSSVSTNGDLLNISFSQPIFVTDYQVSLDYQGTFHDSMAGFAKVPYQFHKTSRYMAVTSLAANNARSVFPCYDEPSYRPTFQLDITVNKSLAVLSNVMHTSVHNASLTTKTFHYDYPEMPVSQLGWAVLDLTTFSTRVINSSSGCEVHTRAPFLYTNYTALAARYTAELVDAFTNYVEYPLPLAKIEHIVIPDFFIGSSDGFGFSSYSEDAILMTPQRTSARDSQQATLELARGVAHLWFGDLVSFDSWSSLWVMKGFSEYFKFFISSSLSDMSSWELDDQVALELMQPALALTSTTTHALAVSTQDEAELISSANNKITKYRGGAVIRMLHHVLGDKVVKEVLKQYFKMTALKTGKESDLWNYLYEEATDNNVNLASKSVEDIVKTWSDNPGYPIVNVTANSTHFIISQAKSDPWYVPVSYVLQGSTPANQQMLWLMPGQSLAVRRPSNNQWILLNVEQTGFYRVKYEASVLQLLTSQLSQDHTALSPLSRSQLIDDRFGFLFSNNLSSDRPLQFTLYLKNETDYYPWHTALRHFQALLDRMYGHSAHSLLQDYVRGLMHKVVFEEVGIPPKAQSSHVGKLRQSLVLEKACAFGNEKCNEFAVKILNDWINLTYYDADLNTALVCAGVANSSVESWWDVWQLYERSVIPSTRANLLKALTCSKNTMLLREFLTNITSSSSPVSSRDKTVLLQTLAATPFGADLLLTWLLDTLQSETNTSSQVSTHTTSATSHVTQPSVKVKSTTIQEAETHTTGATAAHSTAAHSTAAQSTNAVTSKVQERKARVPVLNKLSEDDITAILTYIQTKLTTTEQGTKLDLFVTKNGSTLSPDVQQLMRTVAKQTYYHAGWAFEHNAKISAWLEQTATTSAPGPVTPGSSTVPPGTSTQTPSSAPTVYSSLAISVLIACVHVGLTL